MMAIATSKGPLCSASLRAPERPALPTDARRFDRIWMKLNAWRQTPVWPVETNGTCLIVNAKRDRAFAPPYQIGKVKNRLDDGRTYDLTEISAGAWLQACGSLASLEGELSRCSWLNG